MIRTAISILFGVINILVGVLGIGDRESDASWRQLKEEEGWELPPKAPALLRLPVIRYPRYLWHTMRFNAHATIWSSVGMVPQDYDRWVLYGMYRGWC